MARAARSEQEARPADGEVDRYGHRITEQATLGLLDYVGRHTVDEDYAFVSRRRAERGEQPPAGRRPIGVVGAVVLALFAVLAVTAAVQTSRSSGSEDSQHAELVGQVNAARAKVADDRARLLELESGNDRLRDLGLSGDQSATSLLSRLASFGASTGTRAVRGEGVRVEVDDATGAESAKEMVLDSDLQRLANGLWAAGAEAISLNGQRLTNLSTIRLAGSAITVNNRSLRRPYVMEAIGDKDTLPARFAETTSGQAWLDLQRGVGLKLRITPVDSMRLPAAEVLGLRYANRPAGGRS